MDYTKLNYVAQAVTVTTTAEAVDTTRMFVQRIVSSYGPAAGECEIEMPVGSANDSENAEPLNEVKFKPWWFMPIGSRFNIKLDGNQWFTGTFQRARHSVTQDVGIITILDDRHILQGTPIVGCVRFDPADDAADGLVFYSEKEYPVFNANGNPNMYLHPTYGPVFAPWSWYGVNYMTGGTNNNDQFTGTMEPDRTKPTAQFWTYQDIVTYLRNTLLKGEALCDYILTYNPEHFYIDPDVFSFPEITVPVGDDNPLIQDGKAPEISLRGMNAATALSSVFRSLGPFDLDIGITSDGKARIDFVATAVVISSQDNMDLYVPQDEDVPEDGKPLVEDGVIERDARGAYTGISVRGAPSMYETRLVFLPTAGSTYDQATGVITFGSGSTTLNEYPVQSSILPGWSRQSRKLIGTAEEITQTATTPNLNEEYEFLNYLNGGTAWDGTVLGENYPNTPSGFMMVCSKLPKVFTAFKLDPRANYLIGTRYEGRPSGNIIGYKAYSFLLTALKELSAGSTRKRLPYTCVIETYIYDQPNNTWRWEVQSHLDSIDIDEQGVIWLPSLRDAGLQNLEGRERGSWFGHIINPYTMVPRPIRITLAFELPYRIFENYKLDIPNTDPPAGSVANSWVDVDPLQVSEEYADGYKRFRLADCADGYREYLRFDSWPTPQSIGSSPKAADKYTPDNELLSQRTDMQRYAQRRLSWESIVRRTGNLVIDRLYRELRPGMLINKIVSIEGSVDTPVNSVINNVSWDCIRQKTVIELGNSIG